MCFLLYNIFLNTIFYQNLISKNYSHLPNKDICSNLSFYVKFSWFLLININISWRIETSCNKCGYPTSFLSHVTSDLPLRFSSYFSYFLVLQSKSLISPCLIIRIGQNTLTRWPLVWLRNVGNSEFISVIS